MLDEKIHYNLLKELGENPGVSQRDWAKGLGIGLGKINFYLNTLIEKGSVRISNFRNRNDRLSCLPAYPAHSWARGAGE